MYKKFKKNVKLKKTLKVVNFRTANSPVSKFYEISEWSIKHLNDKNEEIGKRTVTLITEYRFESINLKN